MSRAMEEMEDHIQDLREQRQAVRKLRNLMVWIDNELTPFLKDREDCEKDHRGYHPNEEMRLLSDLEAILGRSGRP